MKMVNVHFRANDGYYVSRVLVDNQPYYNFEEYEDEYGFYNITEDHHVYVEMRSNARLTSLKRQPIRKSITIRIQSSIQLTLHRS